MESKRFHILFFAFFFICVLLSACGLEEKEAHHIEVNSSTDLEVNLAESDDFVLDETSFLTDYDYLLEILSDYYPHYNWLIAETDFMSVYTDKREELEEIRDAYQFHEIVSSVLDTAKNVGHLAILPKGRFELEKKGSIEHPEFYTQEEREILQADKTQAFYDMLPDLVDESESEVLVTYYSELDSLIFEIKSFSKSIEANDNNFIDEYMNKYPGVSNIVFDIRGNVGGDTYFWMKKIVEPIGGENIFTIKYRVKDSSFSRTKHTSFFIDGHEVETGVYEKEEKYDLSSAETSWTNKNKWVLIDNQVYSAADSFANFCKMNNWATLIGDTTSGNGLGLTADIFLLPHSGIIVQFASVYGINADGVDSNLHGVKPDIYNIKNFSALETYKKVIKEEKG